MVAPRFGSYVVQPGSPLVGLWGGSRIMPAALLLSGDSYLGSMGVMMPTLPSIAATASRHRSSR